MGKMEKLWDMPKHFVFCLKLCIGLLLCMGFSLHLDAYEPITLNDKNQKPKYQFKEIGCGFYYTRYNNWMPKLKDAYSKTCSTPILAVRRSIVPATMVDPKGTLFTVSLCNFDNNGPQFQLGEYWYSQAEKTIKEKIEKYYPWQWAYNPREGEKVFLALGRNPCLTIDKTDVNLFKWGFHNVFHPCISQEVNSVCSTCVRVLHFFPDIRLLIGEPGNNGGIVFLKHTKTKLGKEEYGVSVNSEVSQDEEATDEAGSEDQSSNSEGTATEESSEEPSTVIPDILDDSDEGTAKIVRDKGNTRNASGNSLGWNHVLSRWATEDQFGRPTTGFANCLGNFQAFHGSNNMYLYHLCRDGDNVLKERGGVIHYNCYNRKTFERIGGADVQTNLRQTACGIIPRFIRVGSYVYFATFYDGYWMRFYRVKADTSTNEAPELLATCALDIYMETMIGECSEAPYSFDFCVLDKDGTPSTASSKDEDKILCVFHVGGGKEASAAGTLTEAYRWSVKGVDGVQNVTSALASTVIPSSSSSVTYLTAWAQNVIYVTNHRRWNRELVSITNLEKDDSYRVYLNSHKIVPYTSRSGKHYIIYAYCYPGKKQSIYLGYAQYYIDSNRLRLLSKTEFKEAEDGGAWGDSFGDFASGCTRIVSMDLRNGNLWITFLKETNVYTTDHATEDAQYFYFHILAEDLIQE